MTTNRVWTASQRLVRYASAGELREASVWVDFCDGESYRVLFNDSVERSVKFYIDFESADEHARQFVNGEV